MTSCKSAQLPGVRDEEARAVRAVQILSVSKETSHIHIADKQPQGRKRDLKEREERNPEN